MSSSAGRIRSGDGRSQSEATYQGKLGATRLEPVHVTLDDGRIRTLSIHVGINVATDPHLREAALTGALHRFEGGEELAVSYVFHDPAMHKLCVVVPTSLRHQAIDEHAKLVTALAADRSVPLPIYAREAEVVVGPRGLAAFLERPSAEVVRAQQDLMEAQRTALEMERGNLERERGELDRERRMLGQEQQGHAGAIEHERGTLGQAREAVERERAALQQREQRVRERAEAVTSREDELREQAEQHEAQARDLSMREQELEQRLEALVQREQAARLEERAKSERPPANIERPKSIPPAPSLPRGFKPTLSPPTSPIAELAGAEDDVEEIDELEAVNTSPGARRAPTAAEPSRHEADAEAVEEIVDEDDVAEEVDPDADAAEEIDADEVVREEITGVHRDQAPEESGQHSAVSSDAKSDLSGVATSAVARMPVALEDAEMVAEAGDGVDLFVRLPENVPGLGELDLRVRLSTEEGPTALLELVGQSEGRTVLRRAAIDLRNAEERAVLDQLRRRFEANVHFFSHDGRPFDEAKVSAPREVNAARVIDRGVRLKTELGGGAAKARALARPPLAPEPHPFAAEDVPLENAATVSSQLGPLADALTPERLDHALTVLSIPRDQIDAAVARAIEKAISHGLALPTALVERALSSAIVPDAAALVVRQIDAFRGTVLRPDRGHLDEAQVATNWERLLKAAADNEVALDSETHDLAFRAIRTVKGDDTGAHATDVDPDKFAELAAPQLVMMLEHPRYRRAAAMALADKKDAQFADVLCKAVRKMPRHEVVRVLPKLVALGEEAGDALIDGLSARKTFVRQGFALVLGHLKLRRAVVPLLHRLIAEESPVHRELSRVLGSFGNASFRPFARQLTDAKESEERLARTLAHLALAGCDKQVGELKNDADAKVKELAVRGLAMVADARAQDEMVSGKRALDDGDPILAFSRRFEEELRGVAPAEDLAAPPGEE